MGECRHLPAGWPATTFSNTFKWACPGGLWRMEAAIQPSAKGCSHLHRKLGKRFVKPTTRYWLFEVGQLDAWFDRKSPDMIFVTSSTGSASVKKLAQVKLSRGNAQSVFFPRCNSVEKAPRGQRCKNYPRVVNKWKFTQDVYSLHKLSV